MNKEEALSAMAQGHKVTHTLFGDEEYLHMVDGYIYDECGYKWGNRFCEAWTMRSGELWDKDWSIKS